LKHSLIIVFMTSACFRPQLAEHLACGPVAPVRRARPVPPICCATAQRKLADAPARTTAGSTFVPTRPTAPSAAKSTSIAYDTPGSMLTARHVRSRHAPVHVRAGRVLAARLRLRARRLRSDERRMRSDAAQPERRLRQRPGYPAHSGNVWRLRRLCDENGVQSRACTVNVSRRCVCRYSDDRHAACAHGRRPTARSAAHIRDQLQRVQRILRRYLQNWHTIVHVRSADMPGRHVQQQTSSAW
jgi:hypothetical protein